MNGNSENENERAKKGRAPHLGFLAFKRNKQQHTHPPPAGCLCPACLLLLLLHIVHMHMTGLLWVSIGAALRCMLYVGVGGTWGQLLRAARSHISHHTDHTGNSNLAAAGKKQKAAILDIGKPD
jgi:hypothetical protein